MQRRALLLLPLLLAAPALRAQTAAPAELAADLPGARLQGSGLLRFFGLKVYEVRLWLGSQPLADDWAATPLALELQYDRTLYGAQIAERSLKEMRRQGDIGAADADRWLGAMKQVFPDVKENDRITGLNLPGVGARFFVNGALKGDIRDPQFARLFFGIWLSEKTSEPALRNALLGRPG
jgi:hypothetical protein